MTTFAAYPNADGYWRDNGTFDTAGTDFVAGRGSGPSIYGAFFRLTAVTIPSGATINAADQDFTKNSGSGTVDIRVHCEAADDATFPASYADASGRAVTSAYATLNSAYSNGRHTTPDFAAAVQEVVDRGGWASGQAIQFHWRNNLGSGTALIQGRCIERTGTADDPYFTIDYTEPATGSGNLLLLGVG